MRPPSIIENHPEWQEVTEVRVCGTEIEWMKKWTSTQSDYFVKLEKIAGMPKVKSFCSNIIEETLFIGIKLLTGVC